MIVPYVPTMEVYFRYIYIGYINYIKGRIRIDRWGRFKIPTLTKKLALNNSTKNDSKI